MSHGKSVTWAGAWVIVQQTQSTCPHHMVLTPSYCILPTYKRMWKPVPPNTPRHNLRCNTVQATKRHFVRVELSTSFDTHFFYTTERIESIAAVWPAHGLRRSDLGKYSKHDLEYLLDRGELVCHTPGVGHVTCGGWTGGLASIAPDSAAKLKEQWKDGKAGQPGLCQGGWVGCRLRARRPPRRQVPQPPCGPCCNPPPNRVFDLPPKPQLT